MHCAAGRNPLASEVGGGSSSCPGPRIHKLIAVVLGEATFQARSLRAANLLEYGFRTYAWKSLFGMQTLDTMRIDEGAKLD